MNPLRLSTADDGAEFEVVAVGVAEVDRPGRYPFMKDRAFDADAPLFEDGGGALDVIFMNGEGEVLPRPFAFRLLQHDHAGLAAGAQEEPVPLFVAEADSQPEHVSVKRLRRAQFLHPDGNLIDAAYRQH